MIRRLIGVKVITEHGQLLGNISNVYLCVDTEHSIAIEFQLVKPSWHLALVYPSDQLANGGLSN